MNNATARNNFDNTVSLPSPSSLLRVHASFPKSLQCNSPQSNHNTRDVLQSIVQGRKSWKTFRGGEMVWPPALEAALLEGLESYVPDDSRETRILGRYPMRNKFISDHILKKTGKRRTAKQVGSRLQQLRDTYGGERLLNLISPCHVAPRRELCSLRSCDFSSRSRRFFTPSRQSPPFLQRDNESSSDTSSVSSPTTPTDINKSDSFLDGNAVSNFAPQTIIYIDLLPEYISSPNLSLSSTNSSPASTNTDLAQAQAHPTAQTVHASSHPRRLCEIDNTITFLARSTTSARSLFTVYTEGTVVSSEACPLTLLGPAPDSINDSFLYSTALVPKFWNTIMKSSDPTRYTIVQHVVQESPISSSLLMFSAMYKFQYPGMSSGNTDTPCGAQKIDDSFESLISMDNSFGDLIECDDLEACFDFGTVNAEAQWGAFSPALTYTSFPSQASSPSSAGWDDSLSLSPASSCFPPDLFNYVL